MAKRLPKWLLDQLDNADWKPKNVSAPLYTYLKENFEIDILPGMNNRYKVSITKWGKVPVTNVMLLDSETLTELLRNPTITYKK